MEVDKEKHRHLWVQPEINCQCGCTDEGEEKGCVDEDEESEYILKYTIPGAKKENIHIHIIPAGIRMEAPRDKHTVYVSEYAFACEVDADEAEAMYEDGILTVKVPYACPDPFAESKPLEIK